MLLFALMFCPFAFTTGAFVFSGTLQPMADSLGVSVSAVAMLQSAFAISCALCGPFLTHLVKALSPRAVLLIVLAFMSLANAASAIVSDYNLLFLLRVLAGGVGALSLPLATSIGAFGVDPENRPQAVSFIYAGIPLALIIGIPVGSFCGNLFGWPACFAVTSMICFATMFLVMLFVPDAVPAKSEGAKFSQYGLSLILFLAITFVASAALFCIAGLIGPVIRATTGFSGTGIAFVQALVGVSGLFGVPIGAALAKRKAPLALLIPFFLLALSLSVLTLPLQTNAVTVFTALAMFVSVLTGPAAQSITGVLVQSHFAQRYGSLATFAYSLNGSMVYLGQGLGVALSAAVFDRFGIAFVPVAGLVLVFLGFCLSLFLSKKSKWSSHARP